MDDAQVQAVFSVFTYLQEKKKENVVSALLRMSRLPLKAPKTFDNFDFSQIQKLVETDVRLAVSAIVRSKAKEKMRKKVQKQKKRNDVRRSHNMEKLICVEKHKVDLKNYVRVKIIYGINKRLNAEIEQMAYEEKLRRDIEAKAVYEANFHSEEKLKMWKRKMGLINSENLKNFMMKELDWFLFGSLILY